MSLRLCRGCSRHVRASETRCPFCESGLEALPPSGPLIEVPLRLGRAALAALAAGTLYACTSQQAAPPAPVPLYGAPPPQQVTTPISPIQLTPAPPPVELTPELPRPAPPMPVAPPSSPPARRTRPIAHPGEGVPVPAYGAAPILQQEMPVSAYGAPPPVIQS